MTISAQLSSDLRARASFLGYCPVCSFLGIPESPDILRGPAHRASKDGKRYALQECCSLSADLGWYDTQAEVAHAWKQARTASIKCLATQNRRDNTLKKLAEKSLEAIE